MAQEENEKEAPVTTTVTLYVKDLEIINGLSDRTGVKNLSASIRMIVRSWHRQNLNRGVDAWIPEDLSVTTANSQES